MKSYLSLFAGILVGAFAINTAFAQFPVIPTNQGGTGTTTSPTTGQVLVGQSDGTYAPQATSTLGITGGGGGVGLSDNNTWTGTNTFQATTTFQAPVIFAEGSVSTSTLYSNFANMQFGSSTLETFNVDFRTNDKIVFNSYSGATTWDFTGITLNPTGFGDDTVTPDAVLSSGKVDEYCLTYEATGDTFEWAICGAGGGGSGAGWATTTEGSSEVTYSSPTDNDIYIGGSSSTTNKFWFDVARSIFTISSSTDTTGKLDIGTNGVRLFDDGDGALSFLGLADGFDESLTLNLDDTSNTVVWSSTTGVDIWDMSGFNVAVNTLAIGTTTSSTPLVIDDGASATTTIQIGGPGDPGCIQVRDTDDAGYSYGTLLNGSITWSATPCG